VDVLQYAYLALATQMWWSEMAGDFFLFLSFFWEFWLFDFLSGRIGMLRGLGSYHLLIRSYAFIYIYGLEVLSRVYFFYIERIPNHYRYCHLIFLMKQQHFFCGITAYHGLETGFIKVNDVPEMQA
jgi:hypothetical protein